MRRIQTCIGWRGTCFPPLALAAALSLTACTSTMERSLAYTTAEYRRTSVELRETFEDDATRAFPIGSQYRGRRCGNTVGHSRDVLNLATGERTDRAPIASSAPIFTDYILGTLFAPGRTIERQARQASVRHDMCYAQGKGTYDISRADCDRDLGGDLRRICRAANDPEARWSCMIRAEMVEAAVTAFGGLKYGNNAQETCEYEGQLGPARDFVVTGRFGGAGKSLIQIVAANAGELTLTKLALDSRGGSPHFALALAGVELRSASKPFEGAPDEALAGSLARLQMQAQDLLIYPPQVADLDGDGIDEIVLVGIDRPDGASVTSFGMILLPVFVGETGLTGGTAYTVKPTAGPLEGKDLLLQAEQFLHPMTIGEYDGEKEGGRELVLASLATLLEPKENARRPDIAEIRVFEYEAKGGPNLITHTFELTQTPEDVTLPFQAECINFFGQHEKEQQEIYRRFQYRPSLLHPRAKRGGARTPLHRGPKAGPASTLLFFYRDKCEDLGKIGLWSAQKTLIIDRIGFSDLRKLEKMELFKFQQMKLSTLGETPPLPGQVRRVIPFPVITLPPFASPVKQILLKGWRRYGYPILELERGGPRAATDLVALSLCNESAFGADPIEANGGCWEDGDGKEIDGVRPESLVVTVAYDAQAQFGLDTLFPAEDCAATKGGPKTFKCGKFTEFVAVAHDDCDYDDCAVPKRPGQKFTYPYLTGGYLERGSIVARVGAAGAEGIVSLFPTARHWHLLTVRPQGSLESPETPEIVEHVCPIPAAFADDNMRSAPLSAVSVPGAGQDAIVAVRRARDGDATAAETIVAGSFAYGGLVPAGDSYAVLDAKGPRGCERRVWAVKPRPKAFYKARSR